MNESLERVSNRDCALLLSSCSPLVIAQTQADLHFGNSNRVLLERMPARKPRALWYTILC